MAERCYHLSSGTRLTQVEESLTYQLMTQLALWRDWIVKLLSGMGTSMMASGSLNWMDCAQDDRLGDTSGTQGEGFKRTQVI